MREYSVDKQIYSRMTKCHSETNKFTAEYRVDKHRVDKFT